MDVAQLDRSSWRISDPNADERDPSRLLGYIERLERGRYEVLWLGAPMAWAYVDSFDAALAAVVDRAGFAGVIESQRDPTIKAPSAVLFHRIRRRKYDGSS
jgi:hypothetical protein